MAGKSVTGPNEARAETKTLLSTREVAAFIGVNEKMVYALVADKGLPATKITGKWLFPRRLVEQWIELHTVNYPRPSRDLPPYDGLLVVTGSNDPLLDRAISLFNVSYSDQLAVFGNLGSMGGLRALRNNLCHIASSHLLQENGADYNFDVASRELDELPAIINFCRREQGFMVARDNPKKIFSAADLGRAGIRIANRALGTGTRLLLDHELAKAGIEGGRIEGYHRECARHIDVGLEVLSGRADAGPGIRAVAGLLGIGFVPLRWERYDLMVSKERFFDKGVQQFLGLLHEPAFRSLADELEGYDLSMSGKMVFQQQAKAD